MKDNIIINLRYTPSNCENGSSVPIVGKKKNIMTMVQRYNRELTRDDHDIEVCVCTELGA